MSFDWFSKEGKDPAYHTMFQTYKVVLKSKVDFWCSKVQVSWPGSPRPLSGAVGIFISWFLAPVAQSFFVWLFVSLQLTYVPWILCFLHVRSRPTLKKGQIKQSRMKIYFIKMVLLDKYHKRKDALNNNITYTVHTNLAPYLLSSPRWTRASRGRCTSGSLGPWWARAEI